MGPSAHIRQQRRSASGTPRCDIFFFLFFPPPVERDKARRFLVILTRERPPLSKVALKEGFEQVSAGMQRRRQRRRQGCLPRLQRCEAAAPARRSSSTSAFSPVRMERRRGPQRGLPGAPQVYQERRAPGWARPSRRGAWRSRRGAQRARRGFASSDGCRTGLANPSPTICFSSSSKPKK